MAFLKDSNGNFIKDQNGSIMTVPNGQADQEYNPLSTNAQSGIAVAQAVSTKSDATNLSNGDGIGSLKQQNITYQGLLDVFVPAMVAYLVSQGIPQEQAEVYAVVSVETINAMPEGAEKEQAKQMSVPYILYNQYGINANDDLNNIASGIGAIASGVKSNSNGIFSIAIGNDVDANGESSVNIGRKLNFNENLFSGDAQVFVRNFLAKMLVTNYDVGIVSGKQSTQIGQNNTEGDNSASFGVWNYSRGKQSLVSGNMNYIGSNAHNSLVSGIANICKGEENYILGGNNTTSGSYNVTIGNNNDTHGEYSFAIGVNNIGCPNQIVVGNHNRENPSTIFTVGNGTDSSHRSNALEVSRYGQVISGAETVANNTKALTTKKYVDNLFTRISGYNASVAQVLEHDASGNMIWVNKT